MKRLPASVLAAIAEKYGWQEVVFLVRGKSSGSTEGMAQNCYAYGTTPAHQAVADRLAELFRNRRFTPANAKRTPHELTWQGRQKPTPRRRKSDSSS